MTRRDSIANKRKGTVRFLAGLMLVSLLLTASCRAAPATVPVRPANVFMNWTVKIGQIALRMLPEQLISPRATDASIHLLFSLMRDQFPLPFEKGASHFAANDNDHFDRLKDSQNDADSRMPGRSGPAVPSQDSADQPPVATPGEQTVYAPVSVRPVDPDKPMIALTFDDGPRTRTTLQILDTLKNHEAAATFFVLGIQVETNQAALKRMVAEGHEIGNHTYNHLKLTSLSTYDQALELALTQEAIAGVTGYAPRLVRPTFGSFNKEMRAYVRMPLVMWSVDTLDWKDRNASRIASIVLDTARDGDIVIMHDIYDSTADAVREIVPELVRRGFQLVTVSEMAAARGLSLEPGQIFSHARIRTAKQDHKQD